MQNDNKQINLELEHMPNQKLHRYVSFSKSLIRILGYLFVLYNIELAVVTLVASELIGIVEELV